MAVVVIVTCLALTGCGTSSVDSDQESPSPSPAGEPAKVTDSSTLNCSEKSYTNAPSSENRLKVVADVVVLPEADTFGTLQANGGPTDNPKLRYFSKQPLFIRTGKSFDLIVPPEEEGELAIAWGNAPSNYTRKLHVSCDDSDAKWMSFAGGYSTSQRKCVSLIVRVDGDEHRVPIAAGTACPDN